jgi:molybdopterin molybdotransferase
MPAEPAATVLPMAGELFPTPEQTVDLAEAAGLVLAQEIMADRDHPACDVSAVDGYALRLNQAVIGRQRVMAESRIGFAPPGMPGIGVVKIVTGAPVPAGAEAIVRREEVRELGDEIEIFKELNLKVNQDLRRRGDNILAGQVVLPAGIGLGPVQLAGVACFGIGKIRVRRRVRVMMIISGDELLAVESKPEPWQIRDSHAYAAPALLASAKWIEFLGVRNVPDDLAEITKCLADALGKCDAVILSGGVSMGDRDFVPAAIRGVGAKVVFHKLPIRPGRPMLGAIGAKGQAIFGLPGNPLSVLVTARRFANIALRKLAGMNHLDPAGPGVLLVSREHAHPKLWMYPPAVLEPDGRARIMPAKSSGDLVTAARSDGFVEIPPGERAPERVPFYRWTIE